MKLIVILCIEENTPDVRKIFREQKVAVYSKVESKGYKNQEFIPDTSNWFSQGRIGTFSEVFFSFVPAEQSENLLDAVQHFNDEHPNAKNYPLHAFELDVTRTV